MENNMEIPQKTRNKKLPYDPAIPLQGTDPEKTITEKDTCTPVFTAALFTIARKQPRCSLTDEWIRKLWYIYTMDYYSTKEKNGFKSVLVSSRACYTEQSKSGREKQISYINTYIWDLRKWYQ